MQLLKKYTKKRGVRWPSKRSSKSLLSQPTQPKEQYERLKIRRPINAWLEESVAQGKFNKWQFFEYTLTIDLGKLTGGQASQAKLDGYRKGVFDCTIVCANPQELRVYYIEFKKPKTDKSPKGTLTTEQKDLIARAANTPVKTKVVYSFEEFVEYIESELIHVN